MWYTEWKKQNLGFLQSETRKTEKVTILQDQHMHAHNRNKVIRKSTNSLFKRTETRKNQHAYSKAAYQRTYTKIFSLLSFFLFFSLLFSPETTFVDQWKHPSSFSPSLPPLVLLWLYIGLTHTHTHTERERYKCAFRGVSVTYCTVAIVCYGPQKFRICKSLIPKRSIIFFHTSFWVNIPKLPRKIL
jgi:hypothetical protein